MLHDQSGDLNECDDRWDCDQEEPKGKRDAESNTQARALDVLNGPDVYEAIRYLPDCLSHVRRLI